MAYDPDENTVVATVGNGRAMVWNTDPDTVAGQICHRLADPNISRTRWKSLFPQLPYEHTCPS